MIVAHDMPAWLDARHAAMNERARDFYALRNAANKADDIEGAMEWEELGDEHLRWCIALTMEWEDER